ncbi:MAG TPA: LysM peptidoglycan-binding domain-containing protein [Alkalispirochaeta sp.]|nr:LysM peptidoglycan-binding domain-containing protein [Alkalispirochaeta sp.]
MKRTLICFALIAGVLVTVSSETLQHEVADGETLYAIARTYEITVQQLTEFNDIEAPELLLPGTVLTIPGQYQVRKGDTLFSIARRHDSDVDALRMLNDLEDTMIVAGQRLRIPIDSRHARVAGNDSDTTDNTTSTAREPDRSTGTVSDSDTSAVRSIPVAASVVQPLSYDEGGAWPVAGDRRRLEGKFPGIMIEASRGTPVASISSGRVVYSGPHSSFGNVVFVQSAQGYIYVYGGQQAVNVSVGDEIEAGNVLGSVGVTPTSEGAALYFSVWRNNSFIDPEAAPRG